MGIFILRGTSSIIVELDSKSTLWTIGLRVSVLSQRMGAQMGRIKLVTLRFSMVKVRTKYDRDWLLYFIFIISFLV
jgi:hypothetical protein